MKSKSSLISGYQPCEQRQRFSVKYFRVHHTLDGNLFNLLISNHTRISPVITRVLRSSSSSRIIMWTFFRFLLWLYQYWDYFHHRWKSLHNLIIHIALGQYYFIITSPRTWWLYKSTIPMRWYCNSNRYEKIALNLIRFNMFWERTGHAIRFVLFTNSLL